MGRPSEFTEEIGAEICAAVATTTRGLAYICKNNDRFPDWRTVYDWRARNPTFDQNYTRAKELQADLMAEECVDIADDGTNDFVAEMTAQGVKVAFDKEHVQRSKLRIDTRKWMAGKLRPKNWGDKGIGLKVGEDGKTVIIDNNPDND